MKICVTGSLGLVGLSVCRKFLKSGEEVVGIDNNMRSVFFGEDGRTDINFDELISFKNYGHRDMDVRDLELMDKVFRENNFDVVIHTAAQPSHDRAKDILMLDFQVNALGTLNLLEMTRKYSPKAVFIYTSTNKVYGDNPNKFELVEGETRFDFADKGFVGFDENLSIDNCLHSFFGASKLAADIYVQEYGKYFGMNTAVFRMGCVTGAAHASVKLHGFLSFLIKSLIDNNSYEIIGYKGKQVRDQIHADDVVSAMEEVIKSPVKGEVFNLGGGRVNNASVMELIKIVSDKLKIVPEITYNDESRTGDHICYITDFSKFQRFYSGWEITRDLNSIIDEIIKYEDTKKKNT